MSQRSDPHSESEEFEHFVQAQEPVYSRVVRELENGRKESHWMWFIFPQLQGLGRSQMATRYAIASIDAGRRYLRHPVLGARLLECTELVVNIPDRQVLEIFGSPDDRKFHSSMTLFHLCDSGELLFRQALEKYFGAEKDGLTMKMLEE